MLQDFFEPHTAIPTIPLFIIIIILWNLDYPKPNKKVKVLNIHYTCAVLQLIFLQLFYQAKSGRVRSVSQFPTKLYCLS